ncbi:hypothetical protein LWI28_005323 [Acer negundo]|uniref:Uncharacterized protein n=1 Tax=Acer negundo TaxID=4023 RepID=A0AAD5IZ73_ACENE|nr:hypothetical protein LWI28_005323 [Acer negundo]
MQSDDTQHSATSPGIEESIHIDIQDDNDIQSHHEARPRRNDDKNQKTGGVRRDGPNLSLWIAQMGVHGWDRLEGRAVRRIVLRCAHDWD